ncbi:MAG: hypothetical protein CMF23_02295 [Ignavibacteriae bacterium]|nr:hypothetical protein [Ignavibacteriota bacterium]
MNTDYLVLFAIGIVGTIIRLIIPGKTEDEPFWGKLHVSMVYIMILLGICGLILIIIDFF